MVSSDKVLWAKIAHTHTRLQNRAKGGGNYGSVGQRSASLHRSFSREKVTGVASVKGEPSDNFYQSVDASVSSRSEAWRYFGFLVSRNKKNRQTDRQTEDTTQTPEPTHTYGTFSLLF